MTSAQTGALTATSYFRAVVTSGACPAENSNTVTITVDPASVGGTAAGDQTICSGSTPVDITLTGGTGAIQWQSSPDNTTFTNIAGATTATLTSAQTGALTATSYFRAVVTSGACPAENSNTVTITVSKLNIAVSDQTSEPSGNHCPEFLSPFNAQNEAYNPGVTEVIFRVDKELSTSFSWNFNFTVTGTNVTVSSLILSGNGSSDPVIESGNNTNGTISGGDNTEITFSYRIVNVPNSSLEIQFEITAGNDGNCIETGSTTDNNVAHVINAMPAVGSFN